MATVCIVGLPRQLKDRLQQIARDLLDLTALFIGRSKRGRIEFDMFPASARAWLENQWQKDPNALRLVVLPYPKLPGEIEEALATQQELGVDVVRALPNQGGWPSHPPSGLFDARFLDNLFNRIKSEVAPLTRAQPEPTPASGEMRYYKKVGGSAAGDRVVRTNGCKHNNWTPAHRADRAAKGIERAAGGRIRTLARCPECTGGGHWRVVFD